MGGEGEEREERERRKYEVEIYGGGREKEGVKTENGDRETGTATRLQAVLWIRIHIGSVFSNFVNPDQNSEKVPVRIRIHTG